MAPMKMTIVAAATLTMVAVSCQAADSEPTSSTAVTPSTSLSTITATTSATTTTINVPTEVARTIDAEATIDGNTVTVEVVARSFDVAFVSGDTSGETGHLHLYVDREPPAPGDVVPLGPSDVIHTLGTTLSVALEPGEHTLWVVAADGADRALIPPEPVRLDIMIEG